MFAYIIVPVLLLLLKTEGLEFTNEKLIDNNKKT